MRLPNSLTEVKGIKILGISISSIRSSLSHICYHLLVSEVSGCRLSRLHVGDPEGLWHIVTILIPRSKSPAKLRHVVSSPTLSTIYELTWLETNFK
jgi:hypothetical protein